MLGEFRGLGLRVKGFLNVHVPGWTKADKTLTNVEPNILKQQSSCHGFWLIVTVVAIVIIVVTIIIGPVLVKASSLQELVASQSGSAGGGICSGGLYLYVGFLRRFMRQS